MKSACKKEKVFYREIAPLVKKKKKKGNVFKILVRSPWRLKSVSICIIQTHSSGNSKFEGHS